MTQAVTSFVILSACVVQILAQSGFTLSGLTVTIAQGTVIGVRAADGGDYNVFYGIPYAGSTANENRFKAPPPAPTFPGPFIAHDSSVQCAQPTTTGLLGEENCLVVNVYTKNFTTPKPVMVWIDGDEYTTMPNYGKYSFRQLVEKDIVVVSINYRLSIFGFLCLGVEQAPGNAGLKDIIAGLQWINQNIAAFGGNPNNVVLFGHGSGAAMVDLVTLSPLSENLVHKAIASSGTSLAPWAVAYKPVEYAELVGEKLQYTGKSRAELAKSLAETNLDTLGAALSGFKFLNNTPLFAPCIEDPKLKSNSTIGTFLSDAPINIIRSGNYRHVPFITGYANREGTVRATEALIENWFEQMNANFTNALPVDLTNRVDITPNITNFYFDGRVTLGNIEDFFDFEGDTMFLISTIRAAFERALTSTAPVRLYEFSVRGSLNSDWTFPGTTVTGATHRSILKYLFNYDLSPSLTDLTAQSALLARWVAFASTGTPITSPLLPLGSSAWDPVSTNASQPINYMHFDGSTFFAESGKFNPHPERRNFWGNIYNSYYIAPASVAGSSDRIFGFALIVLFLQVVLRFL